MHCNCLIRWSMWLWRWCLHIAPYRFHLLINTWTWYFIFRPWLLNNHFSFLNLLLHVLGTSLSFLRSLPALLLRTQIILSWSVHLCLSISSSITVAFAALLAFSTFLVWAYWILELFFVNSISFLIVYYLFTCNQL